MTSKTVRYAILTVCLLGGLAVARAPGSVDYLHDVAPLLSAHCTQCHRPGQIAPFSLLDYAAAVKHADEIAQVTRERTMPPWLPAAGYGDLLGARTLSEPEIDLLSKWSDGGLRRGEDQPAGVDATTTEDDRWPLGEPDLVVKMPEPFTVRAEGRDIFQHFVIPLNVAQDQLVSAVDFRPGNRRVVHHCVLFLDTTGTARRLDAATPEPGYEHFGGPGFMPTGAIGGWSPGNVPHRLPEGMGRFLQKGSDLVMEVHYHPSGRVETDQSTVAIYFTRSPRRVVAGIWLANYQMEIAAGEKDYRVSSSYTLPAAVTLVGIVPHMHLIGKSMKSWAELPGGAVDPLIWIKSWDYRWQDEYHFSKPVELPAGTRLRLEATYDNSADNPANPNHPPQRVTFGEQTTNEMCFCFYLVAARDPNQLVPLIFDNLRHDAQQPRGR